MKPQVTSFWFKSCVRQDIAKLASRVKESQSRVKDRGEIKRYDCETDTEACEQWSDSGFKVRI